jgi:hypothetical protein
MAGKITLGSSGSTSRPPNGEIIAKPPGLQVEGGGGERHPVGADQRARCLGGGQNRVARSTAG